MMNSERRLAIPSLVALLAMAAWTGSAGAAPLQGGIEERGYMQDPNGGNAQYDYPAPQAVPTYNGNVEQTHKPAPPKKQKPLRGNLESQQQRPPMQGNVQASPPMQMRAQSTPLPAGFMGAWIVNGLRKEVQAQPQFQAAVPQIFAEQTQNIWNITGNPGSGYAFSNDAGVKSQIFVDKVQGDTAFIRYQHPIKNTMAQEAIVMQIVPGGIQFNGLERIKIMKQGEPQPRAEVTYQLMGRRRQ